MLIRLGAVSKTQAPWLVRAEETKAGYRINVEMQKRVEALESEVVALVKQANQKVRFTSRQRRRRSKLTVPIGGNGTGITRKDRAVGKKIRKCQEACKVLDRHPE